MAAHQTGGGKATPLVAGHGGGRGGKQRKHRRGRR